MARKKVHPAAKAVAIKYSENAGVPVIVASGSGYVAEKIIEVAEEMSVPVYTDKFLAETLSQLDMGREIPPEVYEVVAKIYVFVDKIDTIVAMGQ